MNNQYFKIRPRLCLSSEGWVFVSFGDHLCSKWSQCDQLMHQDSFGAQGKPIN
jgi:hypothetical protein